MSVLPERTRDHRITGEQAALRRVATLVAQAAPPEEVFAAVTAEAGRLLGVEHARMSRYDPDGARTVVASWSSAGAAFPVGTRTPLGGRNVLTLVFQTGRPARIDDYAGVSGPAAEAARESGLRASVGVPISVEGRLWGAVMVSSICAPLPAGTEERLAGFTELVATAIANAQARVELRRFAEEQAALRRVATLVARAASPEEVFAAVTAEAGRLLGAHHARMSRFDPDGARTVVASWGSTGAAFPVGARTPLGGRNVATLVFQTRRPVRIDDYTDASGPAAAAAREFGLRSVAGVPISVEGRLWGAIFVGATREEPLPAGTEARLAGFTELVATAIANAQARVELRGSAEEQAALRRVATLVARAAPPEDVFAAVTEEVGRVLNTDFAYLTRYGRDGAATVVGSWARTGAARDLPIGTRWSIGGRNVTTLVFQACRAVRIDDYTDAWGPAADVAREWRILSPVGVPVSVEGRLWGVMFVASTRDEPMPAGTEERLAGFTELVATAIANAQARVELRGFADEQAALRRVATLVARAAPPEEVFAAVTAEAGRLLHAHHATMARFDPDVMRTLVATWSSTGTALPVGARASLAGRNVNTLVFQTGRAVRIDDYADASGPAADDAREFGVRASVGVPISVGGRLWGAMFVGSTQEPMPAGTEERLAGFTELAATAIANAESQAALTASRARIVATADATRRRIERNLHDGAQQHLVSLALQLRAIQAAAPPGSGELVQELDGFADGLTGVLGELREIARGLHPAVLAEGGLRPALNTLAGRSAVPVRLHVQVAGRLPEQIEIAAYYVVAEALTNTAKHARASVADVEVATGDGALHVSVRDDGLGGAHFGHGSGLVGLRDRAEALGGQLLLHSAPGTGTSVQVSLPLDGPSVPGAGTSVQVSIPLALDGPSVPALPDAAAGWPDDARPGQAADPGPPSPAREM
jgi:GAF domain-containing protein